MQTFCSLEAHVKNNLDNLFIVTSLLVLDIYLRLLAARAGKITIEEAVSKFDTTALRMSDNHQGARSFDHTPHDFLEDFRVKSPEALVKNHQIGILQKRAADGYAAELTVRQSPACFSHHLENAGKIKINNAPAKPVCMKGSDRPKKEPESRPLGEPPLIFVFAFTNFLA
jgi:hypothetical protein